MEVRQYESNQGFVKSFPKTICTWIIIDCMFYLKTRFAIFFQQNQDLFCKKRTKDTQSKAVKTSLNQHITFWKQKKTTKVQKFNMIHIASFC